MKRNLNAIITEDDAELLANILSAQRGSSKKKWIFEENWMKNMIFILKNAKRIEVEPT